MGPGAHLFWLHLLRRLGLGAGFQGSSERKEKRAGRKAVGGPECQGQSDSSLTSTSILLPKPEQEFYLLRVPEIRPLSIPHH